MEEKLIITPKTKVLQLIEAYPQLEDVLIDYVPEFKRFKNPVLRRTVARIATLQQAAAIGNVPVEELINKLRGEVGQDLLSSETKAGYNTNKPQWFNESFIHAELDAIPLLAQGEHPVNQVIADYQAMPEGKIFKMIAPFLPAPLIDKLSSLGATHWVQQGEGKAHYIYFYKEKLS
jgi:uncharacterized protein (DUF2249 family)